MRPSRRGIVAALLTLVVAVVCVRLGFWQLDRLDQRRARNADVQQALARPVLDLEGGILREFEQHPQTFVNRRVQVGGVYDSEHDIVLRGRGRSGRPGVEIVTPLRLAGSDAVVLVNRGWAPSPDAATVSLAPLEEPGARVVTGLVRTIPAELDPQLYALDSELGSVFTVQRLHLDSLRRRLPDPILPVYLQQLPDSAHSPPPFRIAIPPLDEGPHLGYAIQWFSFAAIAVIGFLVVALRRRG